MPDLKQEMARVKARLQKIGRTVERKLPGGWGYAVLAFTFDDVHPNMQWISNAKRADMVKVLRETADRLEHGFAGQKGVDDPDSVLCPECLQMRDYEGEHKWPDKCGMCGRPTERLKHD